MIPRSIVNWSGDCWQSLPELEVLYADSIEAGMQAIARESPSIVLTDLILPDGEGLELVKRVREQHPSTHRDPHDRLRQRRRRDASPPCRGRKLHRQEEHHARPDSDDPAGARDGCLEPRTSANTPSAWSGTESVFVLDNDPDLIAAFMKLVREELAGMGFWDETGLVQVSIALQEAVTNAVFHGNLEVSSEHRQTDERIFEQLAQDRRQLEPYRSRRVRIHVQLDRDACALQRERRRPGF